MRQMARKLNPHYRRHVNFLDELPYELAMLIVMQLVGEGETKSALAASKSWSRMFTQPEVFRELINMRTLSDGW